MRYVLKKVEPICHDDEIVHSSSDPHGPVHEAERLVTDDDALDKIRAWQARTGRAYTVRDRDGITWSLSVAS